MQEYARIVVDRNMIIPQPEIRLEFFLHAIITGEACTLEPETRDEEYLYAIASGDTSRMTNIEPVTLVEMYYNALLSNDISALPMPETRWEMFLYSAVTGEPLEIEPYTVIEQYLVHLTAVGGVEYIISSSANSSIISLPNSTDGIIKSITLDGDTLVNYCTDGSKELTLNGDIDIEGTFVTTTEGVDGGKVDVMCEGNTLVNLTKNGQMEKSFAYDGNSTNVTYSLIKKCVLKQEYTLVCKLTNPNSIELQISIDEGWTGCGTTSLNGFLKIKVLPTTINESRNGKLMIYKMGEQDGLKISDCMLLEGDWTNKEIPPYFEGMKSVGQDDENGHKIEILSQNKNLFNGDLEEGSLDIDYGHIINSNIKQIRTKDFIEVRPNMTYTVSCDLCPSGLVIHEYDKNYKHINPNTSSKNTFTTSMQCKYVKFRSFNSDKEIVSINAKLQLEEGTQQTSYIEPKSNKKEILLNEPLRGVGDVKDKIVKICGKWYIERNCGTDTFDGSDDENWTIGNDNGIENHFKTYAIKDSKQTTNIPLKCDKVNVTTHNVLDAGSGYGINLSYYLRINLPNCDVKNGATVDDLKQYLQQNPITIVYQLATPIYEPLEIEPALNTYNDITHISNDSIIPCNMKVKNTGYNTIIKPNTLYTVALDTNKSGTIGMNLGGAKVTTTNNVATITTPATLTDDSLRLYGKGIKGSKVRLLEGDKTNWIPSHFEGMKSSFEDKLQDDGTYKMEILSNNENLFNGAIEQGRWNYRVGQEIIKEKNNSGYRSVDIINLEPNTTYILYGDFKGFGHIVLGTRSNTITRAISINTLNTPITITTRNIETKLVFYTIDVIGDEYMPTNIVLKKKDNNIIHIPHKSNKIQFSSIEPLRKWDRFVFKDGQLMIERGSEQVTLGVDNVLMSKGSPSQVGNTTKSNVLLFNITPPNLKPSWGGSIYEIKCDTFKTVYNGEEGVSNSIDYVFWGSKGGHIATMNNHIRLSINEEELSTSDLAGFENWLRDNNVNILYQTNEPTYEEIPFELQKIILECYENGTLFIDTIISPSGAEIEYPIRKEQLFKAR